MRPVRGHIAASRSMKIMRGEQAGVPEASLAEDVLRNDTILFSILKQTVFTFQSGKACLLTLLSASVIPQPVSTISSEIRERR